MLCPQALSKACLLTSLIHVCAFAQWNNVPTTITASLRGIHNAAKGVMWASGTGGTVLRSEDDGSRWQQCSTPADASNLDFRAIYGWDANHAQVISSGPGKASRLYETTDGCATWHLLFENPDHDGFWDALAFYDKFGFILGDPVDGRFVVYKSDDVGRHWRRDESPGLAVASGTEGVFAASNSSLVVRGPTTLLFGTGGMGGPRIFRLSAGEKWFATKIPIAAGKESAGIFSIAFRDDDHGIAVGGDYKLPSERSGTAAWTSDGGTTWHPASVFPSGYRSAVAWDRSVQAWITVGPNGSDFSRDDGRTWKHLDSGNWNALSAPWVVGAKGRIASLESASPLLR